MPPEQGDVAEESTDSQPTGEPQETESAPQASDAEPASEEAPEVAESSAEADDSSSAYIKQLRAENERRKRKQAELERELEHHRREKLSEQERAVEDARTQAAEQERGLWARRLAESEARAALQGKVSISVDRVVSMLDLDSAVSEDGVDSAAIKQQVDTLLETEPGLAVAERAPAPRDLGVGTTGRSADDVAGLSLDELNKRTHRKWS